MYKHIKLLLYYVSTLHQDIEHLQLQSNYLQDLIVLVPKRTVKIILNKNEYVKWYYGVFQDFTKISCTFISNPITLKIQLCQYLKKMQK